MGGGDLNMKKSWHPLLLKNQERVWLEEKKALEEKKKLEQLRKEKEEERQLQELQRLQEEQTGRKRTEKLEWMYTTPATGTSQNPNDLEDYLLGKKRVDKMLTADDNAKLGAAHKSFIAVQNANNARDVASKIRDDPLLAIKQQEQAALQALMSNPLRLRELQERNGIKLKKDKKEKEERKRVKHARKSREDNRSRSRSPVERHRHNYSKTDDYRQSRRSHSPDLARSHNPDRRNRRSRSPYHRYRRDSRSPPRQQERYHRSSAWPRSDESDNADFDGARHRGRSRSPQYEKRQRSRSSSYERYGDRKSKRSRAFTPPRRESYQPPRNNGPPTDDRAAKLAAMTSNAATMSVERQERLTALLKKEKAELEAEERARAKSKGMGGFLSQEQKKVFGGTGGLEERIRRGRGGLVVDAD
ncbi:Pre-mRNA splicing factor domain containing protein [Amanita muscaria]